MFNLKTFCWRINCWWQLFRRQYAEFPRTISNVIISKKKDFFWFFIAFFKCAQNLEHFQKEDEYPSLIISEIIDAERRGLLNVYKVLLKDTIR